MSKKEIDFGATNVLVRVYEKKLLTPADYEELLEAENLDALLRILNETYYYDMLAKIKGQEKDLFDDSLLEDLLATYNRMYEITPDKTLVDLLTLRYVYHNLKVYFKEVYLDKDLSHLEVKLSEYSNARLRRAVRSGESSVLDKRFLESINEVRRDYSEYQNLYSVDIILDRRYFNHLKSLAVELEESNPCYKGLIDFCNEWIDLNNMSTFLRGLRQGRTGNFFRGVLSSSGSIPKSWYEDRADYTLEEVTNELLADSKKAYIEEVLDSNGEIDLVLFDKLKDDVVMEYALEGKRTVQGPKVLVSYIYGKEIEIKNLGLIFSGVIADIPKRQVIERMRKPYAI